MKKVKEATQNLEILIHNSPLTTAQRNTLVDGLKLLFEAAIKSAPVDEEEVPSELTATEEVQF